MDRPGEPMAIYHWEADQEDFLAVGARVHSTGDEWGAYTVDETAQRHGAGVSEETTKSQEAYAPFPKSKLSAYQEGWLP